MSRPGSQRTQVRLVQFPLTENYRLHSPAPRSTSVLFSATCRPPPCRFASRSRRQKPLTDATLRPMSAKSEELRNSDCRALKILEVQSRLSSREAGDDCSWAESTTICGFSNERLREIALFDEDTAIRLRARKKSAVRKSRQRKSLENDENRNEGKTLETEQSSRSFLYTVKCVRKRAIIRAKPKLQREKPSSDFSFLRIQKIDTEVAGRPHSTPRVNGLPKTVNCCSDTQTDPLNFWDCMAIEETSQDERDSPIRRQFL